MTRKARPERGARGSGTVLVGHPFTSIGKGEELRASFAALSVLDPDCGIYDVYRFAKRSDADHLALCLDREVRSLGSGVRIFHVNGDEVGPVTEALARQGQKFKAGRNVIVPAWELPTYPAQWVPALKQFDEVWAISRFVQEGLAGAGVASHHVGQAVEMPRRPHLGRHYFGIRESSFVFLTFLDLSSYPDRKNPEAALRLYRQLRQRYPFADMQLVIKAKDGDERATEWLESLRDAVGPDAVFVDRPLTSYETQSLISACDCFVSLHRSEGFGRGPAEALWLGRLTIATGWSGNVDYMVDHPCTVNYRLVPVEQGKYPHHRGQLWAEPDLDHALFIAARLLTDGDFARRTARAGQAQVREKCSFRAVGLRMLDRLAALEDRGSVQMQRVRKAS